MKNKVHLRIANLLFLFLFLFPPPLLAYPSLLLTENEIKLIRQNLLSQRETNNLQYFFLSGILYVDANHWALWLNDRMIHPHSLLEIKGFHIKKVMPHKVEFIWNSLPSNKPITFTLHPNQLYFVKENRVISK